MIIMHQLNNISAYIQPPHLPFAAIDTDSTLCGLKALYKKQKQLYSDTKYLFIDEDEILVHEAKNNEIHFLLLNH